MSNGNWVPVCSSEALKPEEALRFDHAGGTFVIVRSPEGEFYAMDGYCSHEKVHLADGIVDGHIIECVKHFGTFDYRNGEARALPACVSLRVYATKIESGIVFAML